ncbi:MAG TPA: T9SS C-terminal target domain-containing protein, partial [Polyangia bacterium]|nr:T9SS C-terminal target domain-containing protein [Polyangia bacterium]
AGSLRAAVEMTGARTIVFNVSGIIALKSKLLITGSLNNSVVTVAGQTAPGKGITIRNFAFGMTGGADVIIRFVRLKVGGYSMTAMDGMGMASADNTIYDHCSISWTIDEAFSSRSAHNITLQRTLISECLNDSYHYDDSTPDHTGTQPHGFAASISGNIGSFHHNLLAHCAGRNWSLAGGLVHGTLNYDGAVDIRNNVVYNWQYRTTDGGAHQVNFVNNYYKPGPASTFFYALNAQNDGFMGGQYYYFVGNVMPGHFDESSQDKGREATGNARDYNPWVTTPFFTQNVTTQSAGDAYTNVLANVGANVPMLDDHDKRVIQETRDGTTHYKGSKTGLAGLPDTEDDVGGYESYPTTTRAADWDTDHDGIPNAWETAHGLNPSDASDGNKTNLSKVGYTNLEMYLNELAGDFK